MKRYWLVAFSAVSLMLGAITSASATVTADDQCGAANPLVVNDGPAGPIATRVANGWDCPAVALEITSNLAIPNSETTVLIHAASILVQTAGDPTDPAQRVQMIHDGPGSNLRLVAESGNLTLFGASIKAHTELRLTCRPDTCVIESDFSDLIAAANFANPAGGGALLLFAGGSVDIQTTNTHGGALFEVTASNGDITLICKSGDTACKDPTVGTPPDILAACVVNGQLQFPCNNINFPDAAALRSVCLGTVGVTCNGGSKEKRFTAKGDIHLEGSTITSIDHISFNTQGGIFAQGATIESNDAIVMNAKNPVDLRGAIISAGAQMNVTAGTGCALPPAICIDATNANIQGGSLLWWARGGAAVIKLCGGDFEAIGVKVPRFNGDSTPPFSPNVLDTAAECGADGPATTN
jgi:hypothetical protein